MIRVTALLFGHYRDAYPEGTEIELPVGSTVAGLATALAARDSRLVGIDRHCRAAVNEEYAAESQPLEDGDTVAFIPPMSGG